MVASLIAGWQVSEFQPHATRHPHPEPSTFRLWPSAILWAMLTSKHGSQPFPPKGQGQPPSIPELRGYRLACLVRVGR